jgi:excisionase family DNA binding protein
MAENDLATDLLTGAPAIAAFLGFSERKTYHLLEEGRLPAFKIGDKNWQARKSTLRRHIEGLEANQRAA